MLAPARPRGGITVSAASDRAGDPSPVVDAPGASARASGGAPSRVRRTRS